MRLDDFVVRYYDDAHDALEVRVQGAAQARSIPREVGKPVQLRPDGTSIEVLRYLPDFKMDENRKIYSASDEPLNPAVEVQFTGPAGNPSSGFSRSTPSSKATARARKASRSNTSGIRPPSRPSRAT